MTQVNCKVTPGKGPSRNNAMRERTHEKDDSASPNGLCDGNGSVNGRGRFSKC